MVDIPAIEIDEMVYGRLRAYISMPILQAMWGVIHLAQPGPALWTILSLAQSAILSEASTEKAALEAKLRELRDRQNVRDIDITFGTTHLEMWSSASPNIVEIQPRHQFNTTEKAAIDYFTKQSFREESEMYKPFAELFQLLVRTKSGKVAVMDTHDKSYFYGQRPDITLLDATYENPHPACVWQLVELNGPSSFLDGDEFRGQCLDYLYKLRRGQPLRRYFSILLANQTFCHWLFAHYQMPYQERQNRHDEEEPDIQISSQLPLADGLAHMVDLLDDIDYQPTLPKFKLAKGTINDVLGITSRCIVVSSTSSDGNQVAIKRVRDHRGTASPDTLEKEIMVLEKAKGGINLPQLTGYTPNFLEFSFTPVGEGLSPLKVNAMPGSLPSIMDGICDGLSFIHSQDIIHRDIRWDNIILVDKNRPVIIDFNSATAANVPVHFSGGYICCPPEVLELDDATLEYTPIPAHDWKAYVLLLHSAIFPRLYENFVVCWVLNKDSEESKALRQLWTSLGASTIWKRGLEAAEAANVDDELRLWVRDFLTIFPDAEQRLQNLFASVRVRPEEVVSTG